MYHPCYHLNSEKISLHSAGTGIHDQYRYRFPVTWDHVEAYLALPICAGYFRRLRCSVHCSKATSTIPSRRFAPSISSLGISKLCTPPCRCISFMVLKLKFKYIIVCIINIVNHIFLMFFKHSSAIQYAGSIKHARMFLRADIVWAARPLMSKTVASAMISTQCGFTNGALNCDSAIQWGAMNCSLIKGSRFPRISWRTDTPPHSRGSAQKLHVQGCVSSQDD